MANRRPNSKELAQLPKWPTLWIFALVCVFYTDGWQQLSLIKRRALAIWYRNNPEEMVAILARVYFATTTVASSKDAARKYMRKAGMPILHIGVADMRRRRQMLSEAAAVGV